MTHCQTLLDSLRESGNRITPQREMIVQALAHSSHHLSAEEVYARVQERTRSVNIATVYRTLDLLVAEGLASRVDMGDGCVVYATMEHGPHIHLVCKRCRHVIQADYQAIIPLRQHLEDQYQFLPDLRHISLIGLCMDCLAELKTKEA